MHHNNSKSAVLITGAAGGLGSALVKTFSQSLAVDRIIATDTHSKKPVQFNDLEKVVYFQMDVSSEIAIRSVRQQLEKDNIRVKFLVNNAGVNDFFSISEANEELLDGILKVNLYGQVLTVSVFLDHLVESKGRVVQISSDSVRLVTPFHPYPASKIAGEAFSVSMRRELKFLGVRLIIIRPGAIQTNLVEEMKSIKNSVKESRYRVWFEKFSRLANSNVGRTSKPEDVANLISNTLKSKSPRLYYSINKNSKVSFFRRFPEKFQDRIFKKELTPRKQYD